MDLEQMKKDLGGGNVFPLGQENVAFAKYFTGECYLNMLTTERVPVGLVTFAPGTINAFHIHHNRRTRLVPGKGKAGQRITRRRCCKYSAGGRALAWSSKGQLVPASGC